MKAIDVYNCLEKWVPEKEAMPGDNTGFLVGDKQSEVKKILICLDITTEIINNAVNTGVNLIITHHPVIWAPLKNVTAESRVFKLIKNGISVISWHTNLDMAKGGVNDCLAKALNLKNIKVLDNYEIGFCSRIGELEKELSPYEFAKFVKKTLGGNIRYTEGKNLIKKVAVCGGAGSDMFIPAILCKADALVTADIKHSMFITAGEKNFTLIDAGHYHTEKLILNPLAEYLKNNLGGETEISVTFSTPVKTL